MHVYVYTLTLSDASNSTRGNSFVKQLQMQYGLRI